MGLDMYLNKEYYVKNWNHDPEDKHYQITVLQGGKPTKIDTSRITTIVTEEMYWRKANQIHNWFVQHVQNGNDDCGNYYVSRKQLEQLLKDVKTVLANHNKADELLPTQPGFFFGSTEYDDSYWEDLEQTKVGLEKCLANKDSGDFQYHSSW